MGRPRNLRPQLRRDSLGCDQAPGSTPMTPRWRSVAVIGLAGVLTACPQHWHALAVATLTRPATVACVRAAVLQQVSDSQGALTDGARGDFELHLRESAGEWTVQQQGARLSALFDWASYPSEIERERVRQHLDTLAVTLGRLCDSPLAPGAVLSVRVWEGAGSSASQPN
jgi:hypothetical protein